MGNSGPGAILLGERAEEKGGGSGGWGGGGCFMLNVNFAFYPAGIDGGNVRGLNTHADLNSWRYYPGKNDGRKLRGVVLITSLFQAHRFMSSHNNNKK